MASSLRRARALLARAGVVLAIGVLLLGIVRGGGRYFYCPMMKAIFDEPCCGERGEDRGHASDAIERPDCCKAKRLATVPPSATVGSPDIAAAPMTAVLPPFDAVVAAQAPAVLTRFRHPARAGPAAGPRRASERRAELMVWNS